MLVTYEQISLAALKGHVPPLPTSANNVKSLVIWACSENDYTNLNTKAKWNPWDTTEPEPGATDFNKAHVKNYMSLAEGLKAWWDTINNGFYPHIIDCLKRSAPIAETCSAIINSPWGSKPTSALQHLVLSDWPKYATLLVGGSIAPTGPVVQKPILVHKPLPVPDKLLAELRNLSSTITQEANDILGANTDYKAQCDSLITHGHQLVTLATGIKNA
jgi:hypothetical protein